MTLISLRPQLALEHASFVVQSQLEVNTHG